MSVKGSRLLLTHDAIWCLRRRVRGQRNEARAMAIYMGRSVGGMKEEIAKVCGVGGSSVVSSTVGRPHAAREHGGTLARRHAQIQCLLLT